MFIIAKWWRLSILMMPSCSLSIGISKRLFLAYTITDMSLEEPASKKIKISEVQEETRIDDDATVAEGNDDRSSNHDSPFIKQTEKDVGITEYITSTPSIYGILKQRFSDFIVHEISLDETIVKLTNTALPQKEPVPKFDCSALQEDVKLKLHALNDGTSVETVEIPIDDLEKTQRKEIHCAIKSLYPKLESNTLDKDGSKVIHICQKSNRTVVRSEWPSHRGKYIHFILYKENKDTMEAINIIASKLRMKAGLFGYGGTKDRRAKTSQLISVKQVQPAKLLGINKQLNQIKIGNIQYKHSQLKLGDLYGNRFTIILRNVEASGHSIDDSMKSLKDNGFINYFGMQRFGTSAIPTQDIGRALLQSDWKGAIDLILKPRPGDSSYFEKCRQVWWDEKDPQKAFEELPFFKRNTIEGKLLNGLSQHKSNDFVNSLNSIPRNIRLMYVHSYQSLIWNKAVSHRIKMHGILPIVGDLVPDESIPDSDVKSVTTKMHYDVKLLTEEDITNGKFSIYDVVIPLPGYDVKYPGHESKDLYTTMLDADGLNIDQMKARVKDYSLPGSYRKIMVLPKDVEWSSHKYDDPTVSLELSDLEELEGKILSQQPQDGKYGALKINFSLPSSTYATMALREVIKMDTSSEAQKNCN